MAGFFDRFRDPEKLKAREERRAEKAAVDQRNHELLAEQRRKEEIAEQIRNEERLARSEWTYREVVDEMRGTTMSMAQLVSENSVDFDFPYNGGCQALIAVRKTHNNYEVAFTITNGQLDGVGDFRVNTKVDQGTIQEWTATEPDQGSHTLMFMTNPISFIRHFQKGDRMIFETYFYQHGRGQFIFNISGLDPRFQVR